MQRLRGGPRPGPDGPAARDPWCCPDAEKERVAFHEGGHAVLAYVLPARRPRPQGDHPARPAWPSASPSSSPSRSATSTRASTSRTRSPCAWAAGCAELLVYGDLSTGRQQRPRRQHRAGPQDGPRVGHERARSVRWPGARRARCSWARTSCTPATTPTRPRRVIDDEVERILRRPRRRPWRCSSSTGAGSTPSPPRSWTTRPSTARRRPPGRRGRPRRPTRQLPDRLPATDSPTKATTDTGLSVVGNGGSRSDARSDAPTDATAAPDPAGRPLSVPSAPAATGLGTADDAVEELAEPDAAEGVGANPGRPGS